MRRYLRRRQTLSLVVAILAGIVIVLVPTLFTLFPAWGTDWTLPAKVGALAVWVVAVLLVVCAGAVQSERIAELLRVERKRRKDLREAAGRFILTQVLRRGVLGFPDDYEFRLFLPDPGGQTLVAWYESEESPRSEAWPVGQGATGRAFQEGNYVSATGAAVWDSTHGLTVEQQERYRDLQVVASAPILDDRVKPIGVLSVSSRVDDGFLASETGRALHQALAEVVASVLIDIFALRSD